MRDMDRRELRIHMRRKRDEIPEKQRAAASAAISIAAAQRARPGETALVYASVGSEVDTTDLIAALWGMGCRVCLPVAEGCGIMHAVEFAPGDSLVRGRYGIAVPANGAVVPPEEIGVIYVPGLAFDRVGNRLGQGGGYYDRYLAGTGAQLIALAFAAQLVDRIAPQAWDVPVDAIITENGEIIPQKSVNF